MEIATAMIIATEMAITTVMAAYMSMATEMEMSIEIATTTLPMVVVEQQDSVVITQIPLGLHTDGQMTRQ